MMLIMLCVCVCAFCVLFVISSMPLNTIPWIYGFMDMCVCARAQERELGSRVSEREARAKQLEQETIKKLAQVRPQALVSFSGKDNGGWLCSQERGVGMCAAVGGWEECIAHSVSFLF
jgi:hypothetical protein